MMSMSIKNSITTSVLTIAFFPIMCFGQPAAPLFDLIGPGPAEVVFFECEEDSYGLLRVSEVESSVNSGIEEDQNCASAVAEIKKKQGYCSVTPDLLEGRLQATCDFQNREPVRQSAVIVIFMCSLTEEGSTVSSITKYDPDGFISKTAKNVAVGDDCAEAIKLTKSQGGDCSVAPTAGGYSASCDYMNNNSTQNQERPGVALIRCRKESNGTVVQRVDVTEAEIAEIVRQGDSCAESLARISNYGGYCSVMPTSSGGGKSASCDLEAPHPFDN